MPHAQTVIHVKNILRNEAFFKITTGPFRAPTRCQKHTISMCIYASRDKWGCWLGWRPTMLRNTGRDTQAKGWNCLNLSVPKS